MKYLIAALCLAAACALWALLQRGSGRLRDLPCGETEPDCTEDCSQRDAACPSGDLGERSPQDRGHGRTLRPLR